MRGDPDSRARAVGGAQDVCVTRAVQGCPHSHPISARGFTFVAVLVLLTVLMLGAAVAGPLWAHQARREREQELLRLGATYARAIASYRAFSPGSPKQYPQELTQLTMDTRFIGTIRHMRALYSDPTQPGVPWALIKDARGQIIGVRSQSQAMPLTQGPVDLGDVVLAPATRYSDWQFLAPTDSNPRSPS